MSENSGAGPKRRAVVETEYGMPIFESILGVVAVWRVTHMLAFEDGPSLAFKNARKRGEETFWGEVLACFYCLSLWVAAPFALLGMEGWREFALLWPALSGGRDLARAIERQGANLSDALLSRGSRNENGSGERGCVAVEPLNQFGR
jgi:hypothetical protein